MTSGEKLIDVLCEMLEKKQILPTDAHLMTELRQLSRGDIIDAIDTWKGNK